MIVPMVPSTNNRWLCLQLNQAPGEAEFQRISSGGTSRRSGTEHSRKCRVSAPADLIPLRHGVAPVSLNHLPSKTTRVSRAKAATFKATQGQGRASVKNSAMSVDRQAILARRVELMKPVWPFNHA